MAEATISLRLTRQAASDPISGSLHGADGRTHAFHGWMGLATALQALIDAPQTRQPTACDGEINDLRIAHHDQREHPG